MASVTIRGLDNAVKERIRSAARRNGRSLEGELRHIITRASSDYGAADTTMQPDIGTQIRALFQDSGEGLELPPRNESQRRVTL
ncbi:MAG: hypothetical protein LBU07_02870 [Coriobacteriales bacterium]|jgi:plasmid stability protein|nr:hypothetical protein [Coriobacteriales bacterium]